MKRRVVPSDVPLAVVGYVRVSTAEQGDSGAGLDAQRRAVIAECERRQWNLVAIHEDVASGKEMRKRPGLDAALASVTGEAHALIVAKVDRLSRSMKDFTDLLDRAQREGWNLVALDLGLDLSTPMGEAMANMTGTFSQLERRLIGQRTREALAVRKAQGVRLGRPRCTPQEIVDRILCEKGAGASQSAIADRLNDEDMPTVRGGSQWRQSTVRAVIQSAALDTA
jgi:DNA invertase Pin-like site-specific DNA recombinase